MATIHVKSAVVQVTPANIGNGKTNTAMIVDRAKFGGWAMTGISRRRFGVSVGALAVSTFTIGTARATNQSQPAAYPIASDVFTTLQRTIVPSPTPSVTIPLYEVSKYQQYGFGNWTFGDPLNPATRTDIMPALYDVSAVTKKAKLLKFFTMTDMHITDKESPNQAIYLQRLHKTLSVSASLYSGIMLYTTHVLDAAVQTINALHKKDPFDFGISLGDACNSTQYNELIPAPHQSDLTI